MNADLLNDAIDTLIATRDFCGDERQALIDWQEDYGKLSADEEKTVLHVFESRWQGYERDARATILAPYERAAAYRDIESGE
jgi:hypothetical protein